MKACKIEGCDSKITYPLGKGLCNKHYKRWRRLGLTTLMPKKTVEQRLMAKIKIRKKTGCWIWIGLTKYFGYGAIKIAGEEKRTHRAMWELKNGAIPDGMCVLHRCDVPACCNPDHLFLGTLLDNARDCVSKGRFVSHNKLIIGGVCGRGHLITADNIAKPDSNGWVMCLRCKEDYKRKRAQTRKNHRERWRDERAI